jgi:phage repressor protein C with HTH and peptisase S24 domain
MNIFSKNLKIARETSGLTQGKLAELVKLKPNSISNYENGVSSPDYDTLIAIVKILDVSLDWIITGDTERDDFKNEAQFISEPILKHKSTQEAGIPLISPTAITRFFSGKFDELEFKRYVVPFFKGADFLLSVTENSMQPTYNSGDIVACQKVPSDTFFQWNKIYVVETEQGALVKRIKKGSSDDCIILSSDNAKYDDFEISRSKVFNIALVIGFMRLG